MTDSPSWLTQPSPAPAAPPAATDSLATPLGTQSSVPPSHTNNSANSAPSDMDDPELPGVILTMRLANMGAAAGLIIVSILGLLDFPGASTFVLSIYAIIGSTLICCLETQLKFLRVMIAVNFGFLFSSAWRFLFYLLLASIAFSYDTLGGKIVGCVILAVSVYNTYVLCRYPSYRKIREKIAEEEDKRIEARISKEVKRQMVGQVTR